MPDVKLTWTYLRRVLDGHTRSKTLRGGSKSVALFSRQDAYGAGLGRYVNPLSPFACQIRHKLTLFTLLSN